MLATIFSTNNVGLAVQLVISKTIHPQFAIHAIPAANNAMALAATNALLAFRIFTFFSLNAIILALSMYSQ